MIYWHLEILVNLVNLEKKSLQRIYIYIYIYIYMCVCLCVCVCVRVRIYIL